MGESDGSGRPASPRLSGVRGEMGKLHLPGAGGRDLVCEYECVRAEAQAGVGERAARGGHDPGCRMRMTIGFDPLSTGRARRSASNVSLLSRSVRSRPCSAHLLISERHFESALNF